MLPSLVVKDCTLILSLSSTGIQKYDLYDGKMMKKITHFLLHFFNSFMAKYLELGVFCLTPLMSQLASKIHHK